MSERYSKIFLLPENLYTQKAPLLIAAGAMLKDNQTGKILAQLKFQSISDKIIKAITVRIIPKDTIGQPIGEAVDYQYLDLMIERDATYGQREPVNIPYASARSFSAAVTKVIFSDNSVWSDDDVQWEQLGKPKQLTEVIKDTELLKQYHLTYGKDCKYSFTQIKDLWYCPCGALNREGEATCHKCNKSFSILNSIDLDILESARDARLKLEQQKREEIAQKKAEAKEAAKNRAIATGRKTKKIALIAIPVIAAVIVVSLLIYPNFIRPNLEYNKATKMLASGQYENALETFKQLDGYKDSSELIKECNYELAKESIDSENYKEALEYLKKAGDLPGAFELRLVSVLAADVGDTVTFGSYEQDNDKTNGEEAIEWVVVKSSDDEVILVSVYNLDCVKYNEQWENTSWKDCSLRKWLGETFYNSAFTNDEKSVICENTLQNEGTGNNSKETTRDKVYILSSDEWNEYSLSGGTKNTEYAIAQGAYNEDDCGWSWLRTEGIDQDHAQEVDCLGEINSFGSFVDCDNEGVRPVICIAKEN